MKPRARLIGEARTLDLRGRTENRGKSRVDLEKKLEVASDGALDNAVKHFDPKTMRGPVQGLGGLAQLTMTTGLRYGLKSYIKPSSFRTLSRVKSEQKLLVGDSDDQLAARFLRMKRLVENGQTNVDKVKVQALAITSEMAKRKLGLETRDVQMLAAIEQLDGAVIELGTGEGKTLVGALVASTRALDGLGVHVLTANPYLAKRDTATLRPLYEGLGLTVGYSDSTMDAHAKRDAYSKDVTYAFGTQVVWDWLDDQTWYRKDFQKMRPLAHCVIDEVHHVLGDAATEPIVLTGAIEKTDVYEERQAMARLARDIVDQLEPSTDFEVFYERKRPRARLSDRGIVHLDEILKRTTGDDTLWHQDNLGLLHEVIKVVETRHEIELDRDYIRNGDEIVLLDPTTDRPNPSARLRFNKLDSVYLRDDAAAPKDTETVGFITNQHFFPMYESIAGMSATAIKMADEFGDIYGARVAQIPSHRQSIRDDQPDRNFIHASIRTMCAIEDVMDSSDKGMPVLIATHDVAESEHIGARLAQPYLCIADVLASSDRLLRAGLVQLDAGDAILSRIAEETTEPERLMLVDELANLLAQDARGTESIAKMLDGLGLPATKLIERGSIGHEVLNAKTVDREDEIVAQAGELKAVTVGTPMALIGTDIQYGEGVAEVGGLRIIAIGHMETEAKDNQLRGRTARQGLPGSTIFYNAPEDDVFTFGAASTMRKLCSQLAKEQAPESLLMRGKWRGAIKRAQERNELDAQYRRRAITKFDGAIQHQRKNFVNERDRMLEAGNVTEHIAALVRTHAERKLLELVEPTDDRTYFVSDDDVRARVQYNGSRRISGEDAKAVLELVPGAPVEAEAMTVDHALGALEIRLDTHLELAKATQKARADRSEVMTPDSPYDPDLNQWMRERTLNVMDKYWIAYLQERDIARSNAFMKAYGEDCVFTAFIRDSAIVFADVQRQMKSSMVDELTAVVDNMQDPLVARLGLVELGASDAPDRIKREAATAALARAEWSPSTIDEGVFALDAIDILAGVDGGPQAILDVFASGRGAGEVVAGYAAKRLEARGHQEAADAIHDAYDCVVTSRSLELSRDIYWQFDPKTKIAALEAIAESNDKSFLSDLENWIPGLPDQGLDVDRAVKRTVDRLNGVERQRRPNPGARRRRRTRGADKAS